MAFVSRSTGAIVSMVSAVPAGEVIARDESRHAALAWATLGWLVRRRPELAESATAALRQGAATDPDDLECAQDALAIARPQ